MHAWDFFSSYNDHPTTYNTAMLHASATSALNFPSPEWRAVSAAEQSKKKDEKKQKKNRKR
jgi:hypothetical protein